MFRVGLTGNVASGKSSVARVWRELGAVVVDADVLAREAVQPGSPALAEIERRLGPGLLSEDGLDRAALRALVFRDANARARLEAIVHPVVARLRREREEQLGNEGFRLVVHDVPLLFEVGLEREMDLVVVVDAPEEQRLERIVRDRGLSAQEARRIMEAQAPAASKLAGADLVIANDGTKAELRTRAEEAWRAIQERARSAAGSA